MTDETALYADRQRGITAQQLLDNEVLTAAFTGLEADYIAAWRATAARDTDARERLWQALQIVGLVRTQLSRWVSDGKLAAREIDDIAKMGERKKIFGVV